MKLDGESCKEDMGRVVEGENIIKIQCLKKLIISLKSVILTIFNSTFTILLHIHRPSRNSFTMQMSELINKFILAKISGKESGF